MKKVFIFSLLSISIVLPVASFAKPEDDIKPPPPPHAGHKHQDVQYTGKILSFKTNPDSAYDGFSFKVKNQDLTVNFPPHMAAKIMEVVKVGDTITVTGHTHDDKPMELHLKKLLKGNQEVEEQKPAFKMPFSDRKMTSLDGNIKEFTKGKRGEINGFYLGDSTIIHLPPKESEELVQNLKTGDKIQIKGYIKPLNENGFVYAKKLNIIDAISVTFNQKEYTLRNM